MAVEMQHALGVNGNACAAGDAGDCGGLRGISWRYAGDLAKEL
jgi:hypothetical protein